MLERELPLTARLTPERQNGPSGCERAAPCQSQLAFSCIQMRKIRRGDVPSGATTSLGGRSKCSLGLRREGTLLPSARAPAQAWSSQPLGIPRHQCSRVPGCFIHRGQHQLEEVPGPGECLLAPVGIWSPTSAQWCPYSPLAT